jgi:uncharacterized HAD superfamily protein
MRIGVDVDGVLYHWERTARYMLRRKLGDEGRRIPEDLYHPSDSWNAIQHSIEDEDWRWLWKEGVEQGLFRYGHVVGGSLEGLNELEERGEIVIVTSRPKHAVKDTIAWLSLMTDKINVRGIHILGTRENKSAAPIDVLIDDALHNVRDMAEAGKPSVLFDQPWNQEHIEDEFPSLVVRGIGWQDAVYALDWILANGEIAAALHAGYSEPSFDGGVT